MNSKDIGEISRAAVLAVLIRKHKGVLLPFGDNLPYDLLIDENIKFVRVQCKTGRIGNGCMNFNTCSSYYHRGGKTKDYRGKADMFGVYCPDNGHVYMIPVDMVGKRACSLRLDEPIRKSAKTKWAKDFILT